MDHCGAADHAVGRTLSPKAPSMLCAHVHVIGDVSAHRAHGRHLERHDNAC